MQVTFCSLERRNKKWNGKEIVTNPSNHLTNQKIVVREFFFRLFVRTFVCYLQMKLPLRSKSLSSPPCERKTLAIKIKMFVKPFFWKNVIILLLLLKCKMYRWRLKNIWESRFVSMRTILKKEKRISLNVEKHFTLDISR
jgi:hypothetical protein